MPSPTTGSFHWLSSVTLEQGNVGVTTAPDAADSSFKFKPHVDPDPLPPSSASLNQVIFLNLLFCWVCVVYLISYHEHVCNFH